MLSSADNSKDEQTEEHKTASLFTQKLQMIQQIQEGLNKEKQTMTSVDELTLALRMQQQLSTSWTMDAITTVLIWITTLRESKKTLEPRVAEEYRAILLRNPDFVAVQQVFNELKKAWEVNATSQLSSQPPVRSPLPRRLAIFSPVHLLDSSVAASPLIPVAAPVAVSQTAAAPDTLSPALVLPRTASLVATPSTLFSAARVKDKKPADMLLRYQPLNMIQRK